MAGRLERHFVITCFTVFLANPLCWLVCRVNNIVCNDLKVEEIALKNTNVQTHTLKKSCNIYPKDGINKIITVSLMCDNMLMLKEMLQKLSQEMKQSSLVEICKALKIKY